MPANAETDPMFTLLTDALRAGPASPQWRDAVAKLRESGAREHDEYRLLINARESLEGGKEYRAVRAGVGFTRRLMDHIDENKGPNRTFRLANIIAVVCGIAIVAALGLLIYHVFRSPFQPSRQAVDQLVAESNMFFNELASAKFDGAIPQQWERIGSLPIDATHGLEAQAGASAAAQAGGGVFWARPLPAERPFTVEITLHRPAGASGYAVEAFVSNSASFSADRATSDAELTWMLHDGIQQVIVDGHVVPAGSIMGTDLTVRLTLGPEVGLVEVGPRKEDGSTSFTRIWSGVHHLGTGARSVGARFLRTGPAGASPTIEQIKVVGK